MCDGKYKRIVTVLHARTCRCIYTYKHVHSEVLAYIYCTMCGMYSLGICHAYENICVHVHVVKARAVISL